MQQWPKTLRWLISSHRRTIALAVYAAVAAVSLVLSFVARFDIRWPPNYGLTFLKALPLLVLVRLAINQAFGITTSSWRFIGTPDVVRLAGATVAGTFVFLLSSRLLPIVPPVPLSILGMECVLTGYFTAGLWVSYRLGYENLLQRHRKGKGRRVLIVGAGEAGNMLAREMGRFPTGLHAVGFVDDDPLKWGSTIRGLEVIGASRDLDSIVRTHRVEELILAIPSAEPAEMRRIIEACEGTGVTYKILPGIREVLSGDVSLKQVRDVEIEDLLGRDPIELELPELAEDLRDRSILVTGAGGSIGSELSTQIALHAPARLVLLDQAETPLFYLGRELHERFPSLEVITVVGDITDRVCIEDVFQRFSPDRVYHAAAYKHVGMMEDRPREAVRNNVCGTLCVAEAAGRYHAAKFVLVSTDKAVVPTSVMGATKRMAEMVALELQRRFPHTAYTAVRFGNVLGSQGSVIPIFKRQLAEGKPLTVTHPEATRYFMTIPEAVQLILQASLLAESRGNISLLDMGEPVRILDLAENLLRLSGAPFTPHSIVFTGLQPGEKLHEELVGPGEDTIATEIGKIRIVSQGREKMLNVLSIATNWEAAGSDDDVLSELAALFPSLRGDTQRPPRQVISVGA